MKTNTEGVEGFLKKNCWYIITSSVVVCIAIGGFITTLKDHSTSIVDNSAKITSLLKTTSELHTQDVQLETKLDGMRNDLTEIKSDVKEIRVILMRSKTAETKDNGLELNYAKTIIR